MSKSVPMQRGKQRADVHPKEVENMALAGWQSVEKVAPASTSSTAARKHKKAAKPSGASTDKPTAKLDS